MLSDKLIALLMRHRKNDVSVIVPLRTNHGMKWDRMFEIRDVLYDPTTDHIVIKTETVYEESVFSGIDEFIEEVYS